MDRPDYLDSFKFNWETFDIIAGGTSSLDAKNYLSHFKREEDSYQFLIGYGFDIKDPVQKAELFGIFQEAIQFIKRYFLKEGNPDGLDLSVPNSFFSITDVSKLLLMATGVKKDASLSVDEVLWAGVILKVMHTILHTDKDLRYRYFKTIQTQIFDRFYKFLHRDENDNLYLKAPDSDELIPLIEFETKAKKTRESIIIKLLHKKENVAEELFDRIGIRFVTKSKVDCLRVMKFLYQNYIIMVNNIKPSRSHNSLIDLDVFKAGYYDILKFGVKNPDKRDEFIEKIEEYADACTFMKNPNENVNNHTSDQYRAIHFTCRQLIKYRNPFLQKFNEVKKLAKEDETNELAQKVLSLDTSSIARDVRFFYPFEVQITDIGSHEKNTEGEASHIEYKKSQLDSAMIRLFKPLIDFHNIQI